MSNATLTPAKWPRLVASLARGRLGTHTGPIGRGVHPHDRRPGGRPARQGHPRGFRSVVPATAVGAPVLRRGQPRPDDQRDPAHSPDAVHRHEPWLSRLRHRRPSVLSGHDQKLRTHHRSHAGGNHAAIPGCAIAPSGFCFTDVPVRVGLSAAQRFPAGGRLCVWAGDLRGAEGECGGDGQGQPGVDDLCGRCRPPHGPQWACRWAAWMLANCKIWLYEVRLTVYFLSK